MRNFIQHTRKTLKQSLAGVSIAFLVLASGTVTAGPVVFSAAGEMPVIFKVQSMILEIF